MSDPVIAVNTNDQGQSDAPKKNRKYFEIHEDLRPVSCIWPKQAINQQLFEDGAPAPSA
jgi:hypothetical protein